MPGSGTGSNDRYGSAGSVGQLAAAPAILTAADAAACASRSYEVQQLAARRGARAPTSADAVLARLARAGAAELAVAGRAGPTGRHCPCRRRPCAAAGTALQDAVAVVLRHARNVALSAGPAGP